MGVLAAAVALTFSPALFLYVLNPGIIDQLGKTRCFSSISMVSLVVLFLECDAFRRQINSRVRALALEQDHA